MEANQELIWKLELALRAYDFILNATDPAFPNVMKMCVFCGRIIVGYADHSEDCLWDQIHRFEGKTK